MEEGDVDRAYEKYAELMAMAPDSPGIAKTLESLEAIRAAEHSPAILLTHFTHSVRDGSIEVSVDGETILREDLWEMRRVAGLVRRRSPKEIVVYSQLKPGSRSVTVSVDIPSLRIQRSESLEVVLESGVLKRLIVALDADSREVTIEVF